MLRPKYERLRRGCSQRTLGIAAHIAPYTVGLIEIGRLQPLPDQLQRLSNVFNVPSGELLKEVTILEEQSVEERV